MGILDKKKRFIDFIVTSHGKRKLAENNFIPSFASTTDKHVFYDDTNKNIQYAANHENILLEAAYKNPNDVIVHEFDDSGKLLVQDVSGSSVVGDKIFNYDSASATKVKKIIATGSMFASQNVVTSGSIRRFKRNQYLRTSSPFENENKTFKITPTKHTFIMSNSVPFLRGPLTEAINIDNAEPLMFDKKLSNLLNFQYLTPKK